MSMIKVIPPGSYEFGEEATKRIKIASAGLYGRDLDSFIKRAGHELADEVKRLTFAKGEVPIHFLAMGATEGTGPNKNGDSWKAAALKRDHKTFEKHARAYRNHKNKDTKKSYGIIKYSYYNEPMKRVELIIALNGTKEAADRNDGLVADEELNLLEKNGTYAGSMAARVPADYCSGCNNRAKNRSEYCLDIEDGGTCKYGGLRHNIGTVHESGHHLHADNRNSIFFDFSKVFKPADRTAFVMGKVASSAIVSGAELAELLNITAPLDLLDPDEYSSRVLDQIKIARELAQRERTYISNSLDNALLTYKPIEELSTYSDYDKSSLLKSLSEEKIALSIEDWLRLTTNASVEKCADIANLVKPCLDNIFSELVEDINLPDLLHSNPCKSGISGYTSISSTISKYANDNSLEKEFIERRLWVSSLRRLARPTHNKSASGVPQAAKQLAKQYGIYQIGFISDTNDNSLCDLIVRYNHNQ